MKNKLQKLLPLLREMLSLKTMLTIKLVPVVYWVLLIFVGLMSVLMMFAGNFLPGFLVLVLAPIFVRVGMEVLLVVFKILDEVKGLREDINMISGRGKVKSKKIKKEEVKQVNSEVGLKKQNQEKKPSQEYIQPEKDVKQEEGDKKDDQMSSGKFMKSVNQRAMKSDQNMNASVVNEKEVVGVNKPIESQMQGKPFPGIYIEPEKEGVKMKSVPMNK
jgi:hypothetical protein